MDVCWLSYGDKVPRYKDIGVGGDGHALQAAGIVYCDNCSSCAKSGLTPGDIAWESLSAWLCCLVNYMFLVIHFYGIL